jgi:hypothetical protein
VSHFGYMKTRLNQAFRLLVVFQVCSTEAALSRGAGEGGEQDEEASAGGGPGRTTGPRCGVVRDGDDAGMALPPALAIQGL